MLLNLLAGWALLSPCKKVPALCIKLMKYITCLKQRLFNKVKQCNLFYYKILKISIIKKLVYEKITDFIANVADGNMQFCSAKNYNRKGYQQNNPGAFTRRISTN